MRLYRFRSNYDYILDELRNDYFYFALPHELNDPMEGFINLYWEGDEVLWKNFLKHYLYTLTNTIIRLYIDPCTSKDPLPIYFDEAHFPTIELQKIFEDIRDAFFANSDITDFIDYLMVINHKVYINELKEYLGFIQIDSIYLILNELKKHSLLDWKLPPFKEIGVFRKLKLLLPMMETQPSKFIKVLFDVIHNVKNELNLSLKIDFKDKDVNGLKSFLFNEFPIKYVDEVKSIAFSTPCIVSFMEDFSSPAFWGYYGNNHKGICLIFEDEKDSDEIRFDFRTSWGGIASATQKVKYQKEYENVNFFRMLGSLPINAIDNFWLTDWNGKKTEYLRIGDNYLTDEWRKEYNETMYKSFAIKLPDWEKEKEHRIVLQKEMVDDNTPDSRKFVYDFNLLKGVIFGLRTEEEHKIEVIEIIKQKCKESGRNDFKFYQAEYNEQSGLLQMVEIRI